MEYGSLERELYLEASPEIVFDVVSQPRHIVKWWSDEAKIEPSGSEGRIVFLGDGDESTDKVVPLTVVESTRPSRFAFRWDFPAGEEPTANNSLMVSFSFEPSGTGTRLTMIESGFREQGWEAAVLEANYLDHSNGWNHFLGRLGDYISGPDVSK